MLNTIDLFVGCGGLSEGFEQTRKYKMIGAVEWEISPVKELRNHLKSRWGINDAEERVLQFDIQRTEELFSGWEDEKYGTSKGLDALVGNQQLDVIIGDRRVRRILLRVEFVMDMECEKIIVIIYLNRILKWLNIISQKHSFLRMFREFYLQNRVMDL